MKKQWIWTMVVAVFVGFSVTLDAMGAAAVVRPTDSPSLSVDVVAGEATVGDATVSYDGATLSFDPPQLRDWSGKGKSPRNFAEWFKPWEPWPGRGRDKLPNTIEVGPRRDPQGVPILGALYRSILPDSVVVTTADGSKTFKMNVDYKFNADWGQIANIDDKLGGHQSLDLKVTCKWATSRLDLIQVDKAGKLSVKKGKPVMVCPALPEADADKASLAGVYVAPWQRDGEFVITADDIFLIDPAAPIAPINADAVSKTLAKLNAGKTVSVAFMGDSVTLGAEASQWWDKKTKYTAKDLTYRGRVIHGLRQMFPKATVKPVEAFKGGSTTTFGQKVIDSTVKPAKPDLLLIAFGLNDATSQIGGKPRLAVPEYKQAIAGMVKDARTSGMEVMLVTPMQPNPWLKNGIAKRIPAYVKALIEIGEEENVAVANVYAEWMNLPSRGIPQYTQLHNWNNHPGPFGHKVYSDVILRFFK